MLEEIYLAGGCFWGLQGYLDLIDGIENTEVGYANSLIENPTYPLVCTGETKATEAVCVFYNPHILCLDHLLWRFFSVINPTALNHQANDWGTQYRNGIYTKQANKIPYIQNFIQQHIAPQYTKKVVTEVEVLENFYKAEEYHQKYLQKNPQGYCHIDLADAHKPLNFPKNP